MAHTFSYLNTVSLVTRLIRTWSQWYIRIAISVPIQCASHIVSNKIWCSALARTSKTFMIARSTLVYRQVYRGTSRQLPYRQKFWRVIKFGILAIFRVNCSIKSRQNFTLTHIHTQRLQLNLQIDHTENKSARITSQRSSLQLQGAKGTSFLHSPANRPSLCWQEHESMILLWVTLTNVENNH